MTIDRRQRSRLGASSSPASQHCKSTSTLAPRFSRAASMPDADFAKMLAAREVIQRLMQFVEGEHPIDYRA